MDHHPRTFQFPWNSPAVFLTAQAKLSNYGPSPDNSEFIWRQRRPSVVLGSHSSCHSERKAQGFVIFSGRSTLALRLGTHTAFKIFNTLLLALFWTRVLSRYLQVWKQSYVLNFFMSWSHCCTNSYLLPVKTSRLSVLWGLFKISLALLPRRHLHLMKWMLNPQSWQKNGFLN